MGAGGYRTCSNAVVTVECVVHPDGVVFRWLTLKHDSLGVLYWQQCLSSGGEWVDVLELSVIPEKCRLTVLKGGEDDG
jgi:hypothetical protein